MHTLLGWETYKLGLTEKSAKFFEQKRDEQNFYRLLSDNGYNYAFGGDMRGVDGDFDSRAR